MKNQTLLRIILLNLGVVIALLFIYPHLMISPGQLIEGHHDLTTDCFACHTAFLGSDPRKCVACHKPEDIGRLTTQGAPIAEADPSTPLRASNKVPFHRDLVEQDCVACHSDHQGMRPYRTIRTFSHRLLASAAQKDCTSCHARPQDTLHRKLEGQCDQCHTQDVWKPATFSHNLLSKAVLDNCTSCHESPRDSLHRNIKNDCGQCHTLERWKPATFDHDRYFRFDHNHQTECATCHAQDDYKQYTCYGCHEHTPANIRAKHLEEGIYDYQNCVECHRSADEDEAKRHARGGKGGKSKDDDD